MSCVYPHIMVNHTYLLPQFEFWLEKYLPELLSLNQRSLRPELTHPAAYIR